MEKKKKKRTESLLGSFFVCVSKTTRKLAWFCTQMTFGRSGSAQCAISSDEKWENSQKRPSPKMCVERPRFFFFLAARPPNAPRVLLSKKTKGERFRGKRSFCGVTRRKWPPCQIWGLKREKCFWCAWAPLRCVPRICSLLSFSSRAKGPAGVTESSAHSLSLLLLVLFFINFSSRELRKMDIEKKKSVSRACHFIRFFWVFFFCLPSKQAGWGFWLLFSVLSCFFFVVVLFRTSSAPSRLISALCSPHV